MNKPSRMKVFRVAAGISQAELAEQIQSYQGRISRVERGASPDPDEAMRIAMALKVPPDYVFPRILRQRSGS